MKKVRYTGKFASVEVEVAPARWQAVEKGAVLECTDTIAAGLLEQRDNWAPVKSRSSSSSSSSKSKSKSKSQTTPPTDTATEVAAPEEG